MKNKRALELYPAGEADFVFPTCGGSVRLSATGDVLTVRCDGDRFAHVQRLRCDPTLREIFGVRTIVGDDTVRRLFAQIAEAEGAAWGAQAAALRAVL